MSIPVEGYPQSESLPDFLPSPEQEPLPLRAYSTWLEETARALPPEQEGAFRASVAIGCPASNEAWAANGVIADDGEYAYFSILPGVVANGVHDPVVTTAMLSQFSQAGERFSSHIPEAVAEDIVIRTLDINEAHPDAVAKVVQWAFDVLPKSATTTRAILLTKLSERKSE